MKFYPKFSALLNRFLSEDCESIDIILRKLYETGELNENFKSLPEKEQQKIRRILKPISERELSKWADKEWKNWHVEQLSIQLYAATLFENLLREDFTLLSEK